MAALRKSSFSKVRRKSLKCSVYVSVIAVSCPGVILSQRSFIFLKVCMFGQYQITPCQPPIFPLLFNENMVFEKTFSGVVDPADVADLLEADTTTFELIQLVPPESEGEIMATMKENSRRFLYPAARLFSGEGASERDVVMRASASFPGISPKVKFSTTSIIEERAGSHDYSPTGVYSPAPSRSKRGSKITRSQRSVSSRTAEWNAAPEETSEAALSRRVSSSSSSPAAHTNKPGKKDGAPQVPVEFGFQLPTFASLSRTSSPHCHRRTCQLSEDSGQKTSHVQSGPQNLGRKTQIRPTSSASGGRSRTSHSSPKPHHRSVNVSSDHKGSRDNVYRFYCNRGPAAAKPPLSPEKRGRSKSPIRRTSSTQPTISAPVSPNISNHSLSLSERFRTRPSYWEQIHSRVQRILQTHRTSLQHLRRLDQ